jgi:adenosylcobyric acid synthase
MKLAPAIMVQGTASSVGKSLVTTALCRLFRQEGLRVLPFKSQNMALNSFVTPEGGEIGRAQAVQAEAAGVPPHVDMNPILLKPEGDSRSQVVVLGRSVGSLPAAEYHRRKPELRGVIAGCLERLRSRCDLLVIEGAGSPAEINLRAQDIVNMHVARAAEARVVLVGDIDRGGVFAAFVGTLELLEPEDRARVCGFLINKFRGDRALLAPGLDFLTGRTGLPVLGVLPFLPALRIADEDSLSLDQRRRRRMAGAGELDIAVVRFPRISNFDDFDPLDHEVGVALRFVDSPEALAGADLVILPGSKSTTSDLGWLRRSGLAGAIAARAGRGEPVLGICGGCQMLGQSIEDPEGVESPDPSTAGLALLPIRTHFRRDKLTAQVKAQAAAPSFLTEGLAAGAELGGYEIHMGQVEPAGAGATPAFQILSRNGAPLRATDGAVSPDGRVVGTLIHGLFENDPLRAALLRALRRARGLPEPTGAARVPDRQAEYDRLAAAVRDHVDLPLLRRCAGLPDRG